MTDAISSSETAFFVRGFLGGSGSFGIGVDCLTAGVAVSSGGATVVVGDAAPAGAGDPAGCARPAEMANVTSTAAKAADFSRRPMIFQNPPPGCPIHAHPAWSRQVPFLSDIRPFPGFSRLPSPVDRRAAQVRNRLLLASPNAPGACFSTPSRACDIEAIAPPFSGTL